MGASVINCPLWSYSDSGLTITANTATINCSGDFTGGGIDYNGATFNLTGATCTITGNNTFAELNVSAATTVTLGATTQTMGKWSCEKAPAANTATLIVDGTFDGGGFTTYYKVQIAGDTTITGSNTFATLGLTKDGAQTITFTDGTTQTVKSFTRDSGTGVKTLQGSGAAGWAITNTNGVAQELPYLSISYSTASPSNIFCAAPPFTNGGNNKGWVFGRKPRVFRRVGRW